MSHVCPTCTEYREGRRENTTLGGVPVHACEKYSVGDGIVGADECPCGCLMREPGAIRRDLLVYGNAFLGDRGQILDPASVTVFADETTVLRRDGG